MAEYRKLTPGKASIVLGRVTGTTQAQRIRSGVFCAYQLDISLSSIGARDTTFTYELYTDYALTKAQATDVRAFIAGMAEMWRLSK